MKRFLILALLVASCAFIAGSQTQSLSLPMRLPIYCPQGQSCVIPWIWPGTTGIIVARSSGTGTVPDNYGDVWTRDNCSPFDNYDCIFSTHFNPQYPSANVKITFPAGFGNAYLLLYAGVWNFAQAQHGTYAQNNSPFPECVNGGDCPYSWTLPVEADPGDLLIAWANSAASGPMVARPGLGWSIEASDGQLAVEDMIAPVEGPYSGTLTWKAADGSDTGGSHWLMGLARYKKN